MITSFDTTVAPSNNGNSSEGGSGNALIIFSVLALVAFGIYKFVIEPEMNKEKNDKQGD